ncbi:glycogen synthase [Oceanivirga salmonicida]|uniref:glycogen synthase n=1 Tax=Oceanivirga salmonicida TaxID=1769291 RepID=UPI0012E25D3D|nr:glycogen synthase [Oceanivirga salmonicida]
MNIMYLGSEAVPFIKTGGLADVLYALPKKMSKLGHEVSVILPKYDSIKLKYLENIEYVDTIEMDGEVYNLVTYPKKGINYYFIENRNLYERGHLYGDMDEDVQYATFCEVVLRFMKKREMKVDIVHCNDWQTGLFPYFLKTRYKHDPFFWDTRVVYTIHNLMYQGKFNNYSLKKLGYDMQKESINFMQIGIEYADVVNTVSPTYAKEIKHPYFAEGLEDIVGNKEIYGILNGIDYKFFNPKVMGYIEHYEGNFEEYKAKNRKKLLDYFDIKDDNSMIITMVSRLVEGKGLDLIKARMQTILKYDHVKVLILGCGDRHYEDYFRHLEYVYPDKFKAYIGYNDELANLMYAGTDLFLMPSRYEPCGLSQMIAMRYGSIPLVRETGGLKDTVKPYNEVTNEGNGFSFTNYNADDMLNTIRYAEDIYFNKKEIWNELLLKNFEIDNSWEKSANEYVKLYEFAKKTP